MEGEYIGKYIILMSWGQILLCEAQLLSIDPCMIMILEMMKTILNCSENDETFSFDQELFLTFAYLLLL